MKFSIRRIAFATGIISTFAVAAAIASFAMFQNSAYAQDANGAINELRAFDDSTSHHPANDVPPVDSEGRTWFFHLVTANNPVIDDCATGDTQRYIIRVDDPDDADTLNGEQRKIVVNAVPEPGPQSNDDISNYFELGPISPGLAKNGTVVHKCKVEAAQNFTTGPRVAFTVEADSDLRDDYIAWINRDNTPAETVEGDPWSFDAAASAGQITASWNSDADQCADGYQVRLRLKGADNADNWAYHYTSDASAESMDITDLYAGNYIIRGKCVKRVTEDDDGSQKYHGTEMGRVTATVS